MLPLPLHRRKRASGADHGASVGPFQQICCGVASQREVGLESGKITGRSTAGAIARTTSSVKRPAGRRRRSAWWAGIHDHVEQADLALPERKLPVLRPPRAAGTNGCCAGRMPGHAFHQQALAIDRIESPPRLGLRSSPSSIIAGSSRARCRCRPTRRRTGDPLLGQRHAGHVDGREQRPGGHRGGALDVVVEGAEPVAIALQQPSGVRCRRSPPTGAGRAASVRSRRRQKSRRNRRTPAPRTRS